MNNVLHKIYENLGKHYKLQEIPSPLSMHEMMVELQLSNFEIFELAYK